MNIIIQYGTGVAALPKEVLKVMDRATKTDLKLLLLLASDPTLLSGTDTADCVRRLAEAAECTPPQAETALAFWRGAGILLMMGEDAVPAVQSPRDTEAEAVAEEPSPAIDPTPSTPAKKPRPDTTLPTYTSQELGDLLESRAETRTFIDECNRIWGKMLNVSEVNTILSLVEYLGLDWDYVITLLAVCAENLDKQGRTRSLRYFEKTAYEFYDRGIVTLPALQEEVRRQANFQESEGKIRRILGIGERAFTANEKKIFSKWLYDFGYGMDIITEAFESCVNRVGKYSIKYMDSILTQWHEKGFATMEQIQKEEEDFRRERAASSDPSREGKLRTLLGLGGRDLTPNEKTIIKKWLDEFGFGMDVLTLAYEITIDAKSKFNMKYMDSVLTNWHKLGLSSPDAIGEHNTRYRAEHAKAQEKASAHVPGSGKSDDYQSSFDTDEFFYDAVRRSLGDDFDIEELKRAEAEKKNPRG